MAKDFCANKGGNTGGPDCDRRRGIPVMIVPGKKEFTPAEAADFETAYKAAVVQPEGSVSKLYPFPMIQQVEKTTEQNTKGTLGLGFSEILREGKPGYQFRVVVGQCLYKALRQFNGYTGPLFVVDDKKAIWGYEKDNGNLAGYSVASFFVSDNDFGNGTDPVSALIEIVLADPEQFHDFSSFASFAFNIKDVKGLQNVSLSNAAAPAANVYKIAIKTACAGSNLYDAYADALAVAGLWKPTVVATGAALTVTSVAKDATLKGWTVTFDNTTYTALPAGAKISLKLDDPALLEAADVFGIESVPLTIIKA